jgi:hypothetical protein
MKTKLASRSAFIHSRTPLSFAFKLIGLGALVVFALSSGTTARAQTAGSLTPEEARKLTEGIKPLVNQSTEGLVEVKHPDGSVSMDLQGRFQNVSVARKEADGSVTQSCVNNIAAATAFFGAKQQAIDAAKASQAPKNKSSRKKSSDR